MIRLSQEQIKDIAERLECGEKCFVHRQTLELVSYPDPLKYLEFDEELFEEEIQKVEENEQDYLEIEGMDSRDSFQRMEAFAGQVDSQQLQERLSRALSQKKPFSHFKHEIDQSGPYRQKWFDFRDQQMIDWVKDRISFLNQTLEE